MWIQAVVEAQLACDGDAGSFTRANGLVFIGLGDASRSCIAGLQNCFRAPEWYFILITDVCSLVAFLRESCWQGLYSILLVDAVCMEMTGRTRRRNCSNLLDD